MNFLISYLENKKIIYVIAIYIYLYTSQRANVSKYSIKKINFPFYWKLPEDDDKKLYGTNKENEIERKRINVCYKSN